MKWRCISQGHWETHDGRFTIKPSGYQWARQRTDKYDYFVLTEVATNRQEHGNSIAAAKLKAESIVKESANATVSEIEREKGVRRALLLEQFIHERANRIESEGLRYICKNPDEAGSVLAYPFDSVRTSASKVFLDGES